MRATVSAALMAFFALMFAGGCLAPPGDSDTVTDSLLAVVLADLHVSEATRQLVMSPDSLRLDSLHVTPSFLIGRDSVLASHGYSDESFTLAMKPYIDNPTRYVALYDRVLDILFQRGESFESQEE